MMTPVGRLVLVRSIAKRELVDAMAWVTMPALIGPVIGPPVGGFITTYATWHWIFIINVPIGLLGIVLATRYIEDVRAEEHERFDVVGMVLAGLGIAGVAFGLSVLGLNFLPWTVVAALVVGGAFFIAAYLVHARRTPQPGARSHAVPAADIPRQRGRRLRVPARHRRAAVPAAADAAGRLRHDAVPVRPDHFRVRGRRDGHEDGRRRPILRRFGFRTILVTNAHRSARHSSPSARVFTPTTPVAVMVALLLVGGFFRSLQFTSINTIAYAEVEPAA